MMRFVPKDLEQLHAALDLLPGEMLVEVGSGVGLDAQNVKTLREISHIPADIVVGIPKQRAADSIVRVDKIGEPLT